ncbi:hypothetical protein [Streptomyces tsukubensis]|uniref:hypothetical protein n=1 Tax=Streptomyces tsukubensis TaxID=83656 RepID=UPI00344E72C9
MTKNPSDDKTPQEWRELLNSYTYPEEVRATDGRRARRRAKKRHREDSRRRTTEWVREQRSRDPLRPGGAFIIVVLVLALGLGARYLWPGLLGEDKTDDGKGSKTAATASPTPGAPAAGGPSTPSSPSASSSSPAPAVDRSAPDAVAREAIRLYLTRTPPQDQTHGDAVLRAAPYMSPALVENLAAHRDKAWDRLVSRGGVSTVKTVTVSPAGKDLPADSPLRVWRKVVAEVHVEGYTNYKETTTLQAEVVHADDGWQVSRLMGL